MIQNLPTTIPVFAGHSGSHLQGIAIDKNREYIYCSFTTCLIKYDLKGKVVGSVKGLCGHLGCIAYNDSDGKVYGSLEFKTDAIGSGVLKNLGYTGSLQDGFYIAIFDIDKIDRLDMDAETDGVMHAVFLQEVLDDYQADGHRYGCSGIDGVTFSPAIGENTALHYLYVAYGIYEDTARTDNDHQIILKYDVSNWADYAASLNQLNMHRSGPQKPDAKYFVYTGNTRYGIQNLEYDPYTDTLLAAVYQGKKEQFPNYPMFFIDRSIKPQQELLRGIGRAAPVLTLSSLDCPNCHCEICGSTFPYGSTGIAALGNGYFYISQAFKNENGFSGIIKLYQIEPAKLNFREISSETEETL